MMSSVRDQDFYYCHDVDILPKKYRGAIVAIGNFDGVHRGHQLVLKQAIDQANRQGVPAVALTFEPHPRSYFHPEKPIFRLTSAQEKVDLLKIIGFNCVIAQSFNKSFAELTADQFIHEIIVDRLAACGIIIGHDFHFGSKRAGTPVLFEQAGKKFGFTVTLMPAFKSKQGVVVSSTLIRSLLAQGDVKAAGALLGYRYTVYGSVITGAKIGRSLGFPTANMQLPPMTKLKHGIYAVRFRRSTGDWYNGVASFGRRPTVEAHGLPLLETYLFDFDSNLYGEDVSVSFFDYLRAEEKFPSLDALIDQMKKDRAQAAWVLRDTQPLSALDRSFSFST